jgi:hypothetical protein
VSRSHPHHFGGEGGHFVLPGPIRLKSFGDDPWGVAGRNLLNLHLKPGPILSWAPRKDYNRALAQFKRDLIAKQARSREKHHKKAILGLEPEELGHILGDRKLQMRKDVAEKFDLMWVAMKKDFMSPGGGSKGDSVGVASAYRDAEQDEVAWNKAFDKKYYNDTLENRLATGDEFGSEALEIIFQYMNFKKAPPGFSGHTHGIAADLKTTDNGKEFTVNSNVEHQRAWQKTWLYKWLVANAWKHKFYQLQSETWHWEYHEGDPPLKEVFAGQAPVSRRPVYKSK